jgi:hypothetical protein
MADPYSNFFSSNFFNHPNYLHNFINHTTFNNNNTFFHYHHHHHHHLQTTTASCSSSSSSPSSPPLKEALPLLSLIATKKEEYEDEVHNQHQQHHHHHHQSCTLMDVDDCSHKVEEKEDHEGVTVALHIGLPSPSSSEIATMMMSSSSEMMINEQDLLQDVTISDDSSSAGFLSTNRSLNKGQYWIPTPSQILIGPTQFSCPVCCKTFNRYNNMQVSNSSTSSRSSSSPFFQNLSTNL